MTLLKSKLAALLLALTFAGSAWASVPLLSTTPHVITATGSFHNEFPAGGAFDDYVSFIVGAPNAGLSWAALSTSLPGVTGMISLGSELFMGPPLGGPLVAPGVSGSVPIPASPFEILGTYGVAGPLALGDYTLHVFGTVAPLGGSYAGTITLAVPEPGEWALFLSGIGLIGLMVRRRTR